MDKTPGKLIFTAYQDENNNIRLAISPQFNSFTNNREYYVDLGDILMKLTIESARKLDVSPIAEKQEELGNNG